MLWAYSAVANKTTVTREDAITVHNTNTNHGVALIEAVSKDEAIGLAYRICRKVYPPSDGWKDHHVMVCPATNVVTYETVGLINKDQ